jgi:hypothetical protein
LRLTFFVSSDGAIREPPKKHSDFWDLIFNLLWAEMTRFHLLTTLFHHNDYPARRLSSDGLETNHPTTEKFLKDLLTVEGMSERHLSVLVSILLLACW